LNKYTFWRLRSTFGQLRHDVQNRGKRINKTGNEISIFLADLQVLSAAAAKRLSIFIGGGGGGI